jgi:hypothetical protein
MPPAKKQRSPSAVSILKPDKPELFHCPRYEGAWFLFDGDRMRFRKEVEAFLQGQLGDPTGKLEVREDGPHWVGKQTLHLSYSHTHSHTHIHTPPHSVGAALLVWSKSAPLGVDIESIDRTLHENPLRLAERFFHPAERAELQSMRGSPEQLRNTFLTLWVKKEAAGKLSRKGLRDSIHSNTLEMPGIHFEEVPLTPIGYRAIIALGS